MRAKVKVGAKVKFRLQVLRGPRPRNRTIKRRFESGREYHAQTALASGTLAGVPAAVSGCDRL